jgi:hypothetical protein
MSGEEWVVKWGYLEAKDKNYEFTYSTDDGCAFDRNKKRDVEKIKNGFHQKSIEEFIQNFKGVDEIINVKTSNQRQHQISFHRGDGVICLFDPIYMELQISADVLCQNEVFPYLIKDESNYIFHLLYNGEFFVVYWDSKKLDSFYGGCTVRNLLESVIMKSTNYEVNTLPPVPFREELRFTFDYGNSTKKYNIKSIDNNLVSISLPDNSNEHLFFKYFFSKAYHDLFFYSRILKCTHEMEVIEKEMSSSYIDLTDKCSEFQKLKMIHLLRKRKLKKEIKELISESFSDYAKYNSKYSYYKLNKEKSLESIKISDFFNIHYQKLKYEIDINEYNFDILHSLITYSKDILITDEGNYNNLTGVILGGLLALIATYVASLI